MDPSFFVKLNKFSVHQVVRIRNDEQTVEHIAKEFAKVRTNKDDAKVFDPYYYTLSSKSIIFLYID